VDFVDNLSRVENSEMTERWPSVARLPIAAAWLALQVKLGLAPRTIDAYGRALADYLAVSERDGIDPLTADRAEIAHYVHDLAHRPGRGGPNVVAIDSGVGLANATMQLRLVAVRLFYDHLVEEGLRESNPVGRGRYARPRLCWPSRARADSTVHEAALDSLRRAVASTSGSNQIRAAAQSADVGVGIRRWFAARGAVFRAHRRS